MADPPFPRRSKKVPIRRKLIRQGEVFYYICGGPRPGTHEKLKVRLEDADAFKRPGGGLLVLKAEIISREVIGKELP